MIRNKNWFCFIFLSALLLVAAGGCSREGKKERYLQRAEGYFKAGDYRRSEIEYLNALRLDRSNVTAVARLSTIYFDRGEFEKAVPGLVYLKQNNPSDPMPRLKLGEFYVLAGQLPKAREELTPLIDGKPEHDPAILTYAGTVKTAADMNEALKRFKAIETSASGRASWHLAMSTLYLRQTNDATAETHLKKALAAEPNFSRVHFNWAIYYWHLKDLERADQSFRKAAELEPIRSPLRMRWIDFKMRTGAEDKGRELLQEMTRQAPDYAPPWLYLARFAVKDNKLADGSNIVQQVLIQEPANAEARLLLAQIKRRSGNFSGSLQELEELKRKSPRSDQITFEMALTHLQSRNRLKAIAALQEALKYNPGLVQASLLLAEMNIENGDLAAAISILQELTKKYPEVSQGYFLLASAYARQERFGEAVGIYQQVEKRHPTNAMAPYFAGMTYRMQNRPAEARRAFERAAAIAPDDAVINYQLVILEVAEKNYEQAMKRVRILAQYKPRLAVAQCLEGIIYFAQTNLAGAETSFKAAVETDPDFTYAYSLLAQVFLTAKKVPEALVNLEASLKQNPRNVSTMMLLGTLYEQSGQQAKAIEMYQKALSLNPQFAPAMNNLAYVFSEKLGKMEEGFNYALKARELSPQDANIADTLGWIYYRRKEYARALPLLQEAASRISDNSEVQFHLGVTHYMMAQENQARLALKRALAGRNFSSRAEAEQRLAILETDPSDTSAATLKRLQAQVQNQPNDVLALIRLARIQEQSGALDKAQMSYEQARKANPNSATLLIQIAQFYARTGNQSEQALVVAREARKLAPEDPVITQLLGSLVLQSGDQLWASSLLEESSRKQPTNPGLFLDLAHAYFSLGRIDDAKQSAAKALQLGGTFSRKSEAERLLEWIAYYQDPARRLKDRAGIEKALIQQPNYAPAVSVNALLELQNGRTNQARALFEALLSKNTHFAPGKKELARIYSNHFRDDKKAYELATEARRSLPEDLELANLLGKISFRRNDFPNAVRFLKESERNYKDDAERLFFLGLAHYHLKQNPECQRALDRALGLNPNSPLAADAKKALTELRKVKPG